MHYQLVEDEIKKPPIDPNTGRSASVTRPETWGSFTVAQRAYETQTIAETNIALSGVGYVLTSGIFGMDIDHCIEGGILTDEAGEIITTLATYAEYSPTTDDNGQPTGVHLLMQGFLPGAYRRAGNIEVYQDERYLTVTGAHIETTPKTLTANQAQLDAVYHKIFSSAVSHKQENTGGVVGPNRRVPACPI